MMRRRRGRQSSLLFEACLMTFLCQDSLRGRSEEASALSQTRDIQASRHADMTGHGSIRVHGGKTGIPPLGVRVQSVSASRGDAGGGKTALMAPAIHSVLAQHKENKYFLCFERNTGLFTLQHMAACTPPEGFWKSLASQTRSTSFHHFLTFLHCRVCTIGPSAQLSAG